MEDSKPGPTQFAAGDTSESNDLRSRIVASLRDRSPNSQGIRVTVFGGTAVLRGTLTLAQDKRLCLECCRHVPGVIRVIDELVVADDKPVHFDSEDDSV
jgi:osmotically-inducible protein OsmY